MDKKLKSLVWDLIVARSRGQDPSNTTRERLLKLSVLDQLTVLRAVNRSQVF